MIAERRCAGQYLPNFQVLRTWAQLFAHLGHAPVESLTTVNVMSMFGLHVCATCRDTHQRRASKRTSADSYLSANTAAPQGGAHRHIRLGWKK